MQEDISKLRIDREKNASVGVKGKKLYLLLVAVIVVAIAACYLLFFKSIKVSSTTVNIIKPARSLSVLNASGYVVAQRKAALASKTTGRLVWLGVEEGDFVKKDQIVAKLENDDVLAAMNQAEANLSLAQANLEGAKAELEDAKINLERQKTLFEKNFATQAELDAATLRYRRAASSLESAKAAVKAAESALQSAKVALEYTLIRAPFDGVVLTKNADIGDIITPLGAAANAKAAVVTIADLSSLLVEADVSESSIGLVKRGQNCSIMLDAIPDREFRGIVHMIVPTADRTRASVMIKVKFLERDRRILPEMGAKVSFLSRNPTPQEEKEVLTVNKGAILEKDKQKYVFLIKNNRAFLTPVVTGKIYGEDVEIISGLKAKDRVVLSPTEKIKDNTKIHFEVE